MSKEPKVEENKENTEFKKGFFKKIWYSIYKIEKYSELSAEGFPRAIKYLMILVAILALISVGVSIYNVSVEVNQITKYIDEKVPELTYKDDALSVESEEPFIDDETEFGKIIIDTKTENEEEINKYINESQEDEQTAIILLKNRIIINQIGISGSVSYNYDDLFGQMGISEFNKQSLVEFLRSSKMFNLYFNLGLVLFIYAFVIYAINSLFNILAISLFGYLATKILKLRIRYVAIFNMVVYSVTLPIILEMVYLILNSIFDFTINYFDVMYVFIASIYMFAALFMIKSDFDKTQGEVQKIVDVEKEVKKEIEKKEKKEEQEKEEKKENKTPSKKDNEKKKKENKEKNNTSGDEQLGEA